MNCKHCGLPIEPLPDPIFGWYHPTIEGREENRDGEDVEILAEECDDDSGNRAEPAEVS